MLLPYRVKVSDTKVTHFTQHQHFAHVYIYWSHFRATSIDKTNKTQRTVRGSKFMFKMSTIYANICIQTTMPLRNRCRDDGVHGPAASTPSADVLSTLNVLSTHIMDLWAVDPLLKHTPDAVVHRIQIWRIRWPHLWRDKLWRHSLQHGDSVTCTTCWFPILLQNVVILENRADIQQKHI